MTHFVHLTVAIQDVINYRFALFPKIHQSDGNVSSSQHGLLGLLTTMSINILLLEKNQIFICKIAHRTIVEIHHVKKIKLLEDM